MKSRRGNPPGSDEQSGQFEFFVRRDIVRTPYKPEGKARGKASGERSYFERCRRGLPQGGVALTSCKRLGRRQHEMRPFSGMPAQPGTARESGPTFGRL